MGPRTIIISALLADITNQSTSGDFVKCQLFSQARIMLADSVSKTVWLQYNTLIKQPKNHLLQIFSTDFTFNGQIWLFYAEMWIILKKLGTLLNPFATGNFAEKTVLKLQCS